jgi:hypothetical protein
MERQYSRRRTKQILSPLDEIGEEAEEEDITPEQANPESGKERQEADGRVWVWGVKRPAMLASEAIINHGRGVL